MAATCIPSHPTCRPGRLLCFHRHGGRLLIGSAGVETTFPSQVLAARRPSSEPLVCRELSSVVTELEHEGAFAK